MIPMSADGVSLYPTSEVAGAPPSESDGETPLEFGGGTPSEVGGLISGTLSGVLLRVRFMWTLGATLNWAGAVGFQDDYTAVAFHSCCVPVLL